MSACAAQTFEDGSFAAISAGKNGQPPKKERFSRTRVRSFLFGDESSHDPEEGDGLRPTPELALMLAVLEDAIACYEGSLKAPRENPQVLRRQAQLWFSIKDWESPFSFSNICEALHLDPQATRERILGVTDSSAAA